MRRRFLGLIRDLDELLATRPEYLLGPWLDRARSWGATQEEGRLYEWNARRLITVWGPRDSPLRDYSGRHWAGLVAGYHLPRWRIWSDHLGEALATGTRLDAGGLGRALTEAEESWCAAQDRYPDRPQGETLEVARRLFTDYASDATGMSAGGRGPR
ncbi:alpha-N-acetylglucosaminidase C-terminal domain-containing protein [Allosalinactinospora lopnorensis]|uniref:alpha-N-acetylglucosaminidase C-terminal domain-containing protein n=1 Tax=Allosalinactinospora lopnorensis TaxID=1352348 RepID=UPI00069854BE|nr:alpha-N-acetylglucosaminidase C-terminal domain-containing protein [Allosalinactinospora lopnorensis]